MNLTSDSYNIYLNSIHNYREIINKYIQYYNNTRISLYNNLINKNYRHSITYYPKYSTPFNLIQNSKQFNIVKIYNTVTSSVQDLLSLIDSNLATIKLNIDNIPNTITELINDVSLQFTNFINVNNIYDRNKFYLNNYYILSYDNQFNNILGNSYTSRNLKYRWVDQLLINMFISANLLRMTNLQSIISDYMININYFTTTNIINQLQQFLDTNYNTIIKEITNVIIPNIYSTISVSNDLKTLLSNELHDAFLQLPKYFNTFLQDIQELPRQVINKSITDLLIHNISYNLTDKIIDTNVIPLVDNINDFDYSIINQYLESVNQYNIQSYMYLAYLYKKYPIKFLNILSLLIPKFIESDILTVDDKPLLASDTQSIIFQMNHSLYNTTCYDILSQYLTKEYINTFWHQPNRKSSEFIIFLYYINLIDKFIESSYCDQFIVSILDTVRNILYKNNFIDLSYNWYKYPELIKLYIKSLLKSECLNIFSNDITKLNDIINFIFSSNSDNTTYDLTINLTNVPSIYNQFYKNQTIINYIHTFIKNFILSNVTKQVYINILSYFLS